MGFLEKFIKQKTEIIFVNYDSNKKQDIDNLHLKHGNIIFLQIR